MRVVVLDTNAAILPWTQGIDVRDQVQGFVGPHRLVLTTSVLQELETLASGNGATSRAAGAAIRAWHDVEPTHLPGDDGVLDVAGRLEGVVVSMDKILGDECRKRGIPVLCVRGPGLDWR